MDLGFVGLGNMGSLMLPHLLKAGYTPAVYDINPAALERFRGMGTQEKENSRAIAEASDVVLTSLPTPPVVRDVYEGPNSLLEGARPGQIFVDLSSVNPSLPKMLAERFTEKGATVLDAPVSGGTTGATAATLAIMVGGDAAALAKVEPVLKCLGSRIFHCGAVGSGSTMKLLNQLLLGINTMAVLEMSAVARRSEVDLGLLKEIVGASTGFSHAFKARFDKAIEHEFSKGFALDLLCKDLRLGLETAKELGLDLPVATRVLARFEEASRRGLGAEDMSAAVTLLDG